MEITDSQTGYPVEVADDSQWEVVTNAGAILVELPQGEDPSDLVGLLLHTEPSGSRWEPVFRSKLSGSEYMALLHEPDYFVAKALWRAVDEIAYAGNCLDGRPITQRNPSAMPRSIVALDYQGFPGPDPLRRLNVERPWDHRTVACARCAGEKGHDCPLCEGRGEFDE